MNQRVQIGMTVLLLLISEVAYGAVENFPLAGSMFGDVSAESGAASLVKGPIYNAANHDINCCSRYNISPLRGRPGDFVDSNSDISVGLDAWKNRPTVFDRFPAFACLPHVGLYSLPGWINSGEVVSAHKGLGEMLGYNSPSDIYVEGGNSPDVLKVDFNNRPVWIIDRFLKKEGCWREPSAVRVNTASTTDGVGNKAGDKYSNGYESVYPDTEGGPLGPTVLTILENFPFFAIGLFILNKAMQYGGNSARFGQFVFGWILGAAGVFVLILGPR
jgi:hypothetical protein